MQISEQHLLWLAESSLNDLYLSATDAFPHTTMRQHATNTIKIARLNWTPFVGVKTLFLRGLAQNEGREYSPMILFKNVEYHNAKDDSDLVEIQINGKNYLIKRLSFNNDDVRVRCECGDFFWRFHHYNYVDDSLYGKDRKKYEAKYRPGSANPMESPGLCKHLMKMMKVLDVAGLVEQDVRNNKGKRKKS